MNPTRNAVTRALMERHAGPAALLFSYAVTLLTWRSHNVVQLNCPADRSRVLWSKSQYVSWTMVWPWSTNHATTLTR